MMASVASLTHDMQPLVAEIAAAHGIVGTQCALLVDGQRIYAEAGLREYSVPDSTVDQATRFQIGSVSKMVTAATIMRLVDQGALALDTPIQTYLHDFRLGDPLSAQIITARHLLSHTAGFDGDFFYDPGVEDGALGKYVDACAKLAQFFRPGKHHSYSNASFAILAYLAATCGKISWDLMAEDLIAEVAGPAAFATSPMRAAANVQLARGHEISDGQPRPVPLLDNPALRPAGAGPVASAATMLEFLASFLPETGRVKRLLSQESIAAMLHREIEGPCETFASAWGLGTMIFDWTNDQELFGHDGAIDGQYTYMRAHAASNCALVLTTNGGDCDGYAQEIFKTILAPAIGAQPSLLPSSVAVSHDRLDQLSGYYRTQSVAIKIARQKDALKLTSNALNAPPNAVPEQTAILQPLGQDRFLAKFEGGAPDKMQRFIFDDDASQPAGLNYRGRFCPRVSHRDAE